MAAQVVIGRIWNINHASGLHEKVRGLGVVGYQPLIKPGASFEYSSGTVHGTYH